MLQDTLYDLKYLSESGKYHAHETLAKYFDRGHLSAYLSKITMRNWPYMADEPDQCGSGAFLHRCDADDHVSVIFIHILDSSQCQTDGAACVGEELHEIGLRMV